MMSACFPWTLSGSHWNEQLDREFYDCDNLTAEEQETLADAPTSEGMVVIVSPSADGGLYCADLHSDEVRDLEHLAVAGMGTTELGVVSLARTLADFHGSPVGAIVAGQGVSDLMTDAAEGVFQYMAPRFIPYRSQVPMVDAAWSFLSATNMDRTYAEFARGFVQGHDAPQTLLKICLSLDEFPKLQSVTGHSKGALTIGWVLKLLQASASRNVLDDLASIRFRTLATVIDPPIFVRNIRQYIGSLDALGLGCSDLSVEHTLLQDVGHSLSRHTHHRLDLHEVLATEPDAQAA